MKRFNIDFQGYEELRDFQPKIGESFIIDLPSESIRVHTVDDIYPEEYPDHVDCEGCCLENVGCEYGAVCACCTPLTRDDNKFVKYIKG